MSITLSCQGSAALAMVLPKLLKCCKTQAKAPESVPMSDQFYESPRLQCQCSCDECVFGACRLTKAAHDSSHGSVNPKTSVVLPNNQGSFLK